MITRRSWQEFIGARPHMIEAQAIKPEYTAIGSYENVAGIALVDVNGVLVNSKWEGWASSAYDRIIGDVQGAAADPEIDGILLRINSPGGETTKAFETADEIVAASKQKPVWAVADMIAYSAGYLLASAANRIYVSPHTGEVGSIGVYTVHLDYSEMLKKEGIRATIIQNPDGKTDGHPFKPLSEAAEADIKASVDYLANKFFQFVGKRRGLEVETVRKMQAKRFDKGATEAIEARLVDRVGNLNQALDQFRGYLDARKERSQFSFSVAAASAANSPEGGSYMKDEKKKADATAAATVDATAAQAAKAPEASDAAVAAVTTDPTAPVVPAAGDAEEIVALCAIAGLPAKQAHDFISQKKSAAEVRAALIEARATESDNTEIVSQIQPHSGTSAKDKTADALKAVVEEMKGGK